MLYKLGSFSNNDKLVNISWIIEKAREFQKKTSTFASLTMLKLDCVDHNKWEYQNTLPAS